MFKKSLIATGLVVTLLTSSGLAAKPSFGKDHHHHPMGKILKQLELTVEQQQDVRQIVRTARDDRDLYAEDMAELRGEMRELIQAETWDAASVTERLQARHELIAQMDLQKAQNKHKIWRLLTDEQRAEMATLIAEKEPKDGSRERGNRMLNKLDLTAQQQTAIDNITAAMQEKADSFKPTHIEFKQAAQALVMSEQFSDQAWQALKQQYRDSFVAMAVAKAESRHQIWNQLTDEQQAQLEQKMASFKDRMSKGKGKGICGKGGKQGKNRRS